jgi:hypothetical protein
MKLIIKLMILVLSIHFVQGQNHTKSSNKNTENWVYDIECEGIGNEGSKLVKVWSYVKKPRQASIGMKNAVHGLIFKGYTGKIQGCSSFSPLVKDQKTIKKYAPFFKEFFKDGGDYLKYVTTATNGMIKSENVIKIKRKQYKVGIIVSVQTDLLRKRLENEGIIRKLSYGF